MFTILGGRAYFYQWDLNQKITVEDASIAELHFSTMLCSEALVCPVKDGAADVPNILLQKGAAITVYGYCGKCYTKVERTFKVMTREKPADYVYTETEVKTYKQLEENIKGLRGEVETLNEDLGKIIGCYTIDTLNLSPAEVKAIEENCINKKFPLVIQTGRGIYLATQIYYPSERKDSIVFIYNNYAATGAITIYRYEYKLANGAKTLSTYTLQATKN